MLVSRTTPLNILDIWAPRYKDRKVLLATYKVKEFNKIVFTKAQHLIGRDFYITGAKARSYPVEDNGKTGCYAVPLDDLESLEYKEDVNKVKETIWKKEPTQNYQLL